MSTQTARGWLAAALTALILLPMQTALADWRDASSVLSVTQAPRAFDRATRQIYSYVTIENIASDQVDGPLRLVIPSSNFSVDGADGTTAASEPYVDIPAPLAAGERVTVRVNFALTRGALSFTTRPELERVEALSVTARGTTDPIAGTAVSLIAIPTGTQDPVTYLWEQTDTSGYPVTLVNPDKASASFVAPNIDAPLDLTFAVTATDGATTTTATVAVTVQPDNIYVTAGKDRLVAAGQTIYLSAFGSGSGGSDSYSWQQLSPTTPAVTLLDPTTDNPYFVVPAVASATDLVFEVTYSDGLKSATDTVTITVQAPIAGPNAPLDIGGAAQQPPLLVVAQPSLEVAAGTTENVTAVAAGGDGNYTWNWKTPIASTGDPACNTTEGADNGQVYAVTLPNACPETDVTYKVGVIVTDGQGNSAEDVTDLHLTNTAGSALVVYAPPLVADEGPLPVVLNATVASGGTAPYTFTWVQTGGPAVTLTDADTNAPSFLPPAVDADTDLTFEVTISDSSASPPSVVRDVIVRVRDTFAITPPQLLSLQLPPAVSVLSGHPVNLGAVASGGVGPYTWSWNCTGGTVAGETTSTLTLTPNTAPDTLTCSVQVQDSAGTPASESGDVTVTVLAAPAAVPLAVSAIPQLHVDEGVTGVGVTAVASGGQGPYTYSWEFVPGILTSLTLTDAGSNVVHFDAPDVSARTELRLRVTVTDDLGATASREASVVVNDIVSDALDLKLAASEIVGVQGHTVALSAGAVSGGVTPYTYQWVQTGGQTVTLSNENTDNPTFTVPGSLAAGQVLTFQLTVTDAKGNTQQATQRVVVAGAMSVRMITNPIPGGADLIIEQSQLSATAVVSNGTPPYHYQWWSTLAGLGASYAPKPIPEDQPTITTELPPAAFGNNIPMTLHLKVTDSTGQVVQVNRDGFIWIAAVNFVRSSGSECVVCGDLDARVPCSDLDLVLAIAEPCPDETPFCMNTVIQRGSDIEEYRRCVNNAICYVDWFRGTSDRPLCKPFDSSFNEPSLTCHLCCYGDLCNLDTNPPEDTLYRPNP